MKYICFVFMCTMFVFLNSEVNADCTESPVKTSTQGPWKTGFEIVDGGDCSKHTCQEDGSWFGLTCPEFQCPPQYYTYRPQDNSKPYPSCCGGCEEK